MEYKTIKVPVEIGDIVYTVQPKKFREYEVVNEICPLKGRVCQLMCKSDGVW